MLMPVKTNICNVMGRTVYLELYSERKISYRVTAGRIVRYGNEINTYGIEVEDSLTGETEKIPDFSPSVKDASAFAEMLTACKVRPKNLYSMALSYLMLSI